MKVRLTPVALEDVAAIHQRRAEHTEAAAERVEAAVFKSLDMLAEFPQFGRKTDQNGVYRWPMGDFRYTIFYRINGQVKTLEVLRIIDSKRVRDLNRVPW
jgi:plasmid stabilization system protein ParE